MSTTIRNCNVLRMASRILELLYATYNIPCMHARSAVTVEGSIWIICRLSKYLVAFVPGRGVGVSLRVGSPLSIYMLPFLYSTAFLPWLVSSLDIPILFLITVVRYSPILLMHPSHFSFLACLCSL
jgi:hypothetical protein